jgi:hypothetical protein
MADMTLDSLIEGHQPEERKRLPDDLLRKIFARLPQQEQDALHARLYPEHLEQVRRAFARQRQLHPELSNYQLMKRVRERDRPKGSTIFEILRVMRELSNQGQE